MKSFTVKNPLKCPHNMVVCEGDDEGHVCSLMYEAKGLDSIACQSLTDFPTWCPLTDVKTKKTKKRIK